jgi:hypothetical protein
MKTIFLFLLLCLPASQEPLKPVRVSVTLLDAGPLERELADGLRSELRQSRRVIITERQADLNIFVAATTIPDGCSNYAATFLVIKGDDSKPWLTILAGKELRPMAKEFAVKLNKEMLKRR